PPESAVPDAAEVARLCALAMGSEAAGDGEFVLPTLLANLDEERRAAVTSVAERVDSALAAMPAREEHGWAWQLLSELIFGQQRAAFDRMVEDVAEVIAVLDRTRDAPPVSFTAPPPADARDVEPVLEVARVGARVPETQEDIDRVLEYLELVERQARVDAACTELGVPLPADEHELGEVGDALGRIATAARAVGALRHDVLFIAEDSPLSVPDVETAQEIAAAILEFAVHGSGVDAARRLDALAEELEALSPVSTTAPEHEQAVAALRRRDAADFAAAVDALGAARREQVDHQR